MLMLATDCEINAAQTEQCQSWGIMLASQNKMPQLHCIRKLVKSSLGK